MGLVEDILEIYFNETTDYDAIADRCGCTVMEVARVLNAYMTKEK